MGSGSIDVSGMNEGSVIIGLIPNNHRNIERQYCIIFFIYTEYKKY
jgi:hypothetical protein